MSAHAFITPIEQLKKGLVYYGSGSRMRKLVHQLVLGKEPVHVGVVGGSITTGNGCSQPNETDWFSVFSRFMGVAFPKASITFKNGAVPGIQSNYAVMCMEATVDPHAQLVFVEFNLNDGVWGTWDWRNPAMLNMERLIRRLLALPGRPAVVLLAAPSHGLSPDPEHGRPLPELKFHETDEDLRTTLAQYYDLPRLSLRTALYRLATLKKESPFEWLDSFADGHHPGDVGHRMMADLAAYLVQETALDLWLDPYNVQHYDTTLDAELLPPPMFDGNLPPNTSMCAMDDAFRELAVETEGWRWALEGTTRRPKKGWVSNTPGARMRFYVDTRRSVPGPVPVHIAYLSSYTNVGMAAVRCVSGCMCRNSTIDAYHVERTSLLYFHSLLADQTARCVIEVEVLNATQTGSYKFKVCGVGVSEFPIGRDGKPAPNDPFAAIAGARQSITLSDFFDDRTADEVRPT